MDTLNVKVANNRQGATGGRRIYVNGKLLSYKQTALFEKAIQDPGFQKRFKELLDA